MRTPTTLSLVRHELGAYDRTRSLLIAVVLGGALVVIAAVLGATLNERVTAGAGVNYEGADIVVRSQAGAGTGVGADDADPGATGGTGSPGGAGISAEDIDTISRLDGVSAADGLTRARAGLWAGGDVTPTAIESLPSEQFRWQHLTDGRYPETGTEVALSEATVASTGLRPGDVVTMGTDEAGDGRFTVVGTVDTRGALDYESADYAVVTPELAQAFAGTEGANEVRVALEPGADPRQVVDLINSGVPVGWPDTTADLISATESVYGIGLGVLTTLINGFAMIAALVALTVLGTVVWASMPGRRSQLALMWLIGATRGQLILVLVLESAAIAFVGGLIAIPVGIGLTYLSLPALGTVPGVPSIPWSQVMVPIAPLIAVPVIAVIGAAAAVAAPVLSAGRVPPADALRRSSGGENPRPVSTAVRLAALLVLAPAALVTPLVAGTAMLVVVVGLFLTALVLAVPALCRAGAGLVARVVGQRHPLAEISAAEIRSFSGRTAATGLAAMLAATVMALSWVSLSSISVIAEERSNDDPGPQLMVGAYAGRAVLDPVVMQALAQVDGVDGATSVDIGQVELVAGSPEETPGEEEAAGSATRMNKGVAAAHAGDFDELTGGRFPLARSDRDTVYLPAAGQEPFADGSTVTLAGPDGERELTVRYVDGLPLPGIVDPDVMGEVGIRTAPQSVWLAVSGDADRGEVLDAVRTVATVGGDLPVTGTVVTDAKVDSLVRTAQRLATAMLAVAVVIAVVGAVVTLTSGLRARAGEFAVLRLLGMEGRQLRRLVGAETIAVGAVSVIIGLAAGVLTGCVVTVAVAGALGVDSAISVPMTALAVMGVVTVAGMRMAVTGPVDNVSLVPPAAALRDANLGGNQ